MNSLRAGHIICNYYT